MSNVKKPDGGSRVARKGEVPDAEDYRITFTTFPFWGQPVGPNGFEQPEPLDRVEVCVKSFRPYGGTWKDFKDVPEPMCAPLTQAKQKVVIKNVPALSELLVTATKDGYRSSLYAVTTGQFDQDMTAGLYALDSAAMRLFPSDSAARFVPPANSAYGDLTLNSLVCPDLNVDVDGSGVLCRYLAGVKPSLEPVSGSGADGKAVPGLPFYWYGGKTLPDATATVSGELLFASPTLVSTVSGATFLELPENEYVVDLAQPKAFCHAERQGENTVFGFAASALGELRAPVLKGYSTLVVAGCECRNSTDPSTCAPPRGDGAAP